MVRNLPGTRDEAANLAVRFLTVTHILFHEPPLISTKMAGGELQ
jgi:hypothetical protein